MSEANASVFSPTEWKSYITSKRASYMEKKKSNNAGSVPFFRKNIFFFITVYLQYYFISLPGVQHRGQTVICFTKCPTDISCTHLSAYIVMTKLLTTLPMLYFTSPWLFITTNVYLSPLLFSPSPSGNHQSLFMGLFQFCLYIYFVLSILHISGIIQYLSFFPILKWIYFYCVFPLPFSPLITPTPAITTLWSMPMSPFSFLLDPSTH